MSVLSAITNIFKSNSKEDVTSTDRHEILRNLLSTQQYVEAVLRLINVIKDRPLDGGTPYKDVAIITYKQFSNDLPHHIGAKASKEPFSDLISIFNLVDSNLKGIEDNFPSLFVGREGKIDETDLRASSLVVFGYIQMTDDLCTWTKILLEHLTSDTGDMIPPFRTKFLKNNTKKLADFSNFVLSSHNQIIDVISQMQKKGTDAVLKNSDAWIDAFVHDSHYSMMEREMIAAATMPIAMIFIRTAASLRKWWIEFLVNNREWLTAKVIFETEKLNGLDPNSAQYKKLKRTVDYYSDLISTYDQRLERARS